MSNFNIFKIMLLECTMNLKVCVFLNCKIISTVLQKKVNVLAENEAMSPGYIGIEAVVLLQSFVHNNFILLQKFDP